MTGPTEHELHFTAYLASLVPDENRKSENRAALAALRRGLGKRPGEAPEMFPHVMPFIGDDMPLRRQDDYFLVAALFAAHQLSWPAAEDAEGSMGESERDSNMGASFRRLRASVESDSIEKRFVALLNAAREDVSEHLRSAVSLLKARKIPVNWAVLLHDLTGWEYEGRPVQRAWAQAYWRFASGRSGQDQQNQQTAQTESDN